MDFFKISVSCLFAVADGLVTSLRYRTSGTCVVLNYHSIANESRERFGRQLDRLLQIAQVVPLREGQVLERGKRYVAITVDDVFKSFLENGLPELCRRNIPVTLFPPTGYLGRESAWEDYGGENKVGETVVSAEELQQLAQQPNVEFGSHTVTHADLSMLNEEGVRKELRQSKETLEAIIGREIVALSFPYGSYGARELRLAREAGYRFFFDSTPQTVFSTWRQGLVGRVDVQPTDWNLEFRLKVTGAYRWIRGASNWKRKVRKHLGAAAMEEEPVHG